MHSSALTRKSWFTYDLPEVSSRVAPWILSAWLCGVLTLVMLGFSVIDERTLYGVSVWTKPIKFYMSLSVYFATIVWFARYIPSGYFEGLPGRTLIVLPVLMSVVEMTYITYQASLGEASHFNTGNAFNAAMYSIMGFGAVVLVSVLAWIAWLVARFQRMDNPMALSIVIGLVLTFALGGGFGGYLGGQAGHWVGGTANDANGLMLFKWSRDGGDLRVAHFFGMHAMQAVPLFTLLLARIGPSLSTHTQIACTLAFACAYAAFTSVTFWQALQGVPFIS